MKQIIVIDDILIGSRLFENHPSAHSAYPLTCCVVFKTIGIKLEYFFGYFAILTVAPQLKLIIQSLSAQVPPLCALVIKFVIHGICINIYKCFVQKNMLSLCNIFRKT